MTYRRSPSFSSILLSSFLLALFPSNLLLAGGHRRAVATPSESLAIAFGDAPLVDVGTIASTNGRAAIVKRTLTVRIGQTSEEARGTATLRAFLQAPDPYCTIRLDGIVLGTAPRVIAANAPIGIAVTHRLEVEVPVTAPEGTVASTITFEATTD